MKKAIVLFSGGLDSTTCLLWARREFEITALCFDYGHRHAVELEQAAKIAAKLNIEYDVLDLRALHSAAARSALTRKDVDVAPAGGFGGLPSTFVPGRNLVFLTLAASYALPRDVRDLVTGVCQTDHAGYPDCRRETVDALERAINLGNGIDDFVIHTPLVHRTKAETIRLARELGGWEILRLTHTCYEGKRPSCGACPSCVERRRGFAEAGALDPLEIE